MGGEGGRKRRGGRAREEPISAGFGTWGGLYVRAGEGAQGARWDSWGREVQQRELKKKEKKMFTVEFQIHTVSL